MFECNEFEGRLNVKMVRCLVQCDIKVQLYRNSYKWCGEKSLRLFLFNSSVHNFNIRLASLVASRDVLGHARKNVSESWTFPCHFCSHHKLRQSSQLLRRMRKFFAVASVTFFIFYVNFFIFLRRGINICGSDELSSLVFVFFCVLFYKLTTALVLCQRAGRTFRAITLSTLM